MDPRTDDRTGDALPEMPHPGAESVSPAPLPPPKQQQQYQGPPPPIATRAGPNSPRPSSPSWLLAVRGLQVVVSLPVLGVAAAFAHDVYLHVMGLAIVISVLTWLGTAAAVLADRTFRLPLWTFIVTDVPHWILWLATMASVAAARNDIPVITDLLPNSRRGLADGDGIVLLKKGADMMVAIAILAAVEWVLYTITVAVPALAMFKERAGSSNV